MSNRVFGEMIAG